MTGIYKSSQEGTLDTTWLYSLHLCDINIYMMGVYNSAVQASVYYCRSTFHISVLPGVDPGLVPWKLLSGMQSLNIT